MTPGQLNQRIKIERKELVPDDIGGDKVVWKLVGKDWAHITSEGGSEGEEADRIASTLGYTVTIRWRPGIMASDRIVWLDTGMKLNIVAPKYEGVRQMYVQLKCEFGKPQ